VAGAGVWRRRQLQQSHLGTDPIKPWRGETWGIDWHSLVSNAAAGNVKTLLRNYYSSRPATSKFVVTFCPKPETRVTMGKPILLSVDDDSDVLRAIERDLRSQYGAEYRVIGSDSPEGALTLLK